MQTVPTLADLTEGAIVRVAPPYTGSNTWGRDEWANRLVRLLRPIGTATWDCTTKLDVAKHSEWEVNLHSSRLVPTNERERAAWEFAEFVRASKFHVTESIARNAGHSDDSQFLAVQMKMVRTTHNERNGEWSYLPA